MREISPRQKEDGEWVCDEKCMYQDPRRGDVHPFPCTKTHPGMKCWPKVKELLVKETERADEAESELDELKKQLPPNMRACTVAFWDELQKRVKEFESLTKQVIVDIDGIESEILPDGENFAEWTSVSNTRRWCREILKKKK